MTKTPVVLIIFRRPDLTRRVLEAIAKARPQTLLVVADGPRPGCPGDVDGCAAARAVIEQIDWDCEVIKNYSDVNLGCGLRPGTGITWAFKQVPEAIILEDDCIPLPSFFPFCEELLERYRDDERVMHISGSTLRREPRRIAESYYFSQFNVAAGAWATWSRAWRYFDAAVGLWPQLRNTSWLADRLEVPEAIQYWAREFERAYNLAGNVSYWDHQWTFACWANEGLSIAPRTNLAANVGAGADATHMFAEDDPILNVPVADMPFPLVHPLNVLQWRKADREFLQEVIVPRLVTRSRLHVLGSHIANRTVRAGYRMLTSGRRSAARPH